MSGLYLAYLMPRWTNSDNFLLLEIREMIVDVIDIRKRIQRIRNDVSDAIVARHDTQRYDEQLTQDAEFSVVPAETNSNISRDDAKKAATSSAAVSQEQSSRTDAIATYRGVANALAMPSFNLNITNRHSSTLLISLIILQLVTNIILITLLMLKLG